MYRLTDYGSMVRDRRRIDAYTRALSAVITPSSVVLDLGAGIGTFSVLACNAGAAQVYAVEPADVITVAEEIAKANGVSERIRFIQRRADALELPEKVDVIVSDLSGALPLFDEHIPAVIHARDAFLKPGGVLVPARDRLFCAPVSSGELYSRMAGPWRSVPGLDLGPAESMALNAAHALRVDPNDLAAEPRCFAELDYATIVSPNVSAAVEWRFDAAAVIHGIALWFETTLHGDIRASSGPWSPESVHATMVLPLLEPLNVRAGNDLQLSIEAILAAGRYVVTWQAGGGARQSTFASEPRSAASFLERHLASPPATGVPEHATFRAAERVLCRRVGDELLVLDPQCGVYHVLNETAMKVWESLERGGVDTIAAAVAADFDVDDRRAAGDVAAILMQLQEAKLIERV